MSAKGDRLAGEFFEYWAHKVEAGTVSGLSGVERSLVRCMAEWLTEREESRLHCARCGSKDVYAVGLDPVATYRCSVCYFHGWDHRAVALWRGAQAKEPA